jgi:hypothetical protein
VKKEKRVLPEKLVIKAKKDPEVIKEIKAIKAQMETKEKEAIREREEPPELLATPVKQEKEV